MRGRGPRPPGAAGAEVSLRPPPADHGRPPVGGRRGRVVLQFRHPWADGTTHLRFEPTAFLERLAVLTPRPRHVNPRIRVVRYLPLSTMNSTVSNPLAGMVTNCAVGLNTSVGVTVTL